MEWVAYAIGAVVVFFAARMVFSSFRGAVADSKDLVRNPTPAKIATALWTLAFIAAATYNFFVTADPNTALNISVGLFLTYFVGLFWMARHFRAGRAPLTKLDIIEKLAVYVLFSIIPITLYWTYTTGASPLWIIAAVAVWFVGENLIHTGCTRLRGEQES